MADKRSAIYHNMYIMLEAGLDILKAFKTVNQGLVGSYRRSWMQLEQSVKAGSTIAEAMEQQPKFYDKFDILMISAAEKSGNLPKAFDLLSKWYEFRHRIIMKIRSGMILPLIVLNIAAFVFPLPSFVTGGLNVSQYFMMVWVILSIFYIPALCILFILFFGKKITILNCVLDYAVLWVPALGKGIYNLSLSRYSRSFYMLSSAGLGAIETAQTACELTGNHMIKGFLKGSVQAVRAGSNASEGFESDRLPSEFLDLWRVGEESGTMDKVTAKLADITADRAEFWLNNFAVWFPRFVYFLVGIMLIFMIFMAFSSTYGKITTGF